MPSGPRTPSAPWRARVTFIAAVSTRCTKSINSWRPSRLARLSRAVVSQEAEELEFGQVQFLERGSRVRCDGSLAKVRIPSGYAVRGPPRRCSSWVPPTVHRRGRADAYPEPVPHRVRIRPV